jgi:hypothetical protein
MLFGLTPDQVPFTRPAPASPNATARMPGTQWLSHINPFPGVMPPMSAASAFRPRMPGQMGPQQLPAMPAPAPVAGAWGADSPVQPEAPQAPTPAAPAQFWRNGGMSPYQVMRAGFFPTAGYSMRQGVVGAGALVRGATNPVAQANRPAGTYMVPRR